ncbi:IS3 family transposase [Amycolatopsis sp. cmx-8-4]|uniref:IS3 family transposase n=1 Tax=Amycolatopsis sp. cmx-8-4 TaxID=2790947 RepID=UPI00397E64D7
MSAPIRTRRPDGCSGTELNYRCGWPTRNAVHTAIFEYIEGWYNTRRLHSSLGYLSPSIYEATHRVA